MPAILLFHNIDVIVPWLKKRNLTSFILNLRMMQIFWAWFSEKKCSLQPWINSCDDKVKTLSEKEIAHVWNYVLQYFGVPFYFKIKHIVYLCLIVIHPALVNGRRICMNWKKKQEAKHPQLLRSNLESPSKNLNASAKFKTQSIASSHFRRLFV